MRDEHADQADHLLHRAVRVIEESSFLVHSEFIGVRLAGRDGFLADVGHAVLLDGNFEAVPVHRRALGQAIFEFDSDAVALLHLNCGPWRTSVVAPDVERLPGNDFAFHRLRN